MKTIVITGSSSGIGEQTALYFANQGMQVIATVRNLNKVESLKNHKNIAIYNMDVVNVDSVKQATDSILKDFNKIDIILNNAGYGLLAPFEETTDEQIVNMFNTNVFGVMNVTRSFLPTLKKQNSGLIINLTSIGGLVTMPLNSVYHSTKYAVEGFSEGLIYELASFGIKVKLIEPGGVTTNFANVALSGNISSTGDYKDIIENTINAFQANRENNGYSTAEEVAKAIYDAATDETDRIRYIVGKGALQMYQLKQSTSDSDYVKQVHDKFNPKK